MTKTIMKKVNLLMLTLVMVLACEAPNQEIFSEIDRDLALSSTDPNVLQMFAQSAYTPLNGTWGGHNSLWSLHEIASDEMAITQKGADWEDGGQWIRVHRHQYLPTEESINNGWAYCYSAIGNINNLLVSFGDNPLLRSEFEVLRGIIYMWLIDAYGNVPIITELSTDATPPTNTRQEVFTFIENSLKDNLDNLRQERTYATVNYFVAQTALAKLYLNAQVYTGTPRWQDAITACNAVIDAGVYSLEADFMNNFVTRNAGSSENIFVLNYDEDNAGGFNLPQMTLHYESQRTYRLQEQPWNGYSSLEEFYNSFDENDRRIASFIEGPQFAFDGTPLIDLSAEDDDPDGPPLNFTPNINMLAPNAFRQAGVRVGKFEFRIGAASSLSNDYPIFRYADVLLMKAEALWRLNAGSTEALDLVNQVRLRSHPTPLASLNADALLAERGREFFAEASRRTDLIRFGRYNDPWWQKPASDATRNIFPIPLPQIQANPSLTQNPGYN
ncbi:MAG TPA: RagB/SusD family nutrient uptake outer membrane protein [Cyclobacteriaceae bacterium]|nr:RagB/SusD family nutrient uptake outer membrane protein [Cyclobacteriaceae bacterium]